MIQLNCWWKLYILININPIRYNVFLRGNNEKQYLALCEQEISDYETSARIERSKNLIVAKMTKLIMCAKISEVANHDAQLIMNNVDFPTMIDITDPETAVMIEFLATKFNISSYQFQRMIINYINAYLAAEGHDKELKAKDRYNALKQAIFLTEEVERSFLDEFFFHKLNYKLKSTFSEEKISAFYENTTNNEKKLAR